MRVPGDGARAGRFGRYAAVWAALLFTSGCGGAARGPQDTVADFLHALGDKDTDRACTFLVTGQTPYRRLASDELLQCSSGMRAAITDPARAEDLAALRTATVTGADVTGDTAVVRAAQLNGVPDAFHLDLALVRVDGQWYLMSATDD